MSHTTRHDTQHVLAGTKNIYNLLASPHLEAVDIRSVYAKFPGLQQLYQRSLNKDSFYLIKLFVDLDMPGPGSFYGFSALYQGNKADASAKVAMKLFSSGVPVLEKIQIAITQHDSAYGMPVCYFNRYVVVVVVVVVFISDSPPPHTIAVSSRASALWFDQGTAVRGAGEPS